MAVGKSKMICFHIRHKLYAAIGVHIRNTLLKEIVKIDSAFTSINLKGMKSKDMSRKK
ncbi:MULTISPECIES: hypothetical protein [Bacillota]|nr:MULTISPECIES: hypothetical protein [Bacillota]MDB7993866.1 hypothetical protein [Faecalicoccus pleomorphus]MDY4869532.1 hypothetical protein [Faecalicoccus sp.]